MFRFVLVVFAFSTLPALPDAQTRPAPDAETAVGLVESVGPGILVSDIGMANRDGYDLIKTHGDFSREAFHRLMLVARRENMKVIWHAPRNLGVEPMFAERMDAVAHSEEFLYAYFFFGAPDMSRADPDARRRFLENAEQRIPVLATATAKAATWSCRTSSRTR